MDKVFITKQAQEKKDIMMSDVQGNYDYMHYIDWDIISKDGEPWLRYNVDIFGGLRGEMPLPEDLTEKMTQLYIFQNIPIMNMEYLRWEVEKITGINDVPDPEETSGDSFGENFINFTDSIEAWNGEDVIKKAAFESFQDDEEWDDGFDFITPGERIKLLSPHFTPDPKMAYDYFLEHNDKDEADRLIEIYKSDPFADEIWKKESYDPAASIHLMGNFDWEAFFHKNYDWRSYYRGDYEDQISATGYLIVWLR